MKVQELVFRKQKTTYKDVANELIKQLRDSKNKKNSDDLDDEFSELDEDEFSKEESPTKRGGETQHQQQKWEKNVRRRVYDALNVLYAAGVLKKDGKHVSCDNKVLHLTNRLRDQNFQDHEKRNNYSSHELKML